MENQELLDTWTITVTMTVFAGDMSKESVVGEAERQLTNLLDGTDFAAFSVVDAERDTL